MAEFPLYQPLSAQDASFVFFERRATHMHVAALALFEVGPLRSAAGGVDAARLEQVVAINEYLLGRLEQYEEVGAVEVPAGASMGACVISDAAILGSGTCTSWH